MRRWPGRATLFCWSAPPFGGARSLSPAMPMSPRAHWALPREHVEASLAEEACTRAPWRPRPMAIAAGILLVVHDQYVHALKRRAAAPICSIVADALRSPKHRYRGALLPRKPDHQYRPIAPGGFAPSTVRHAARPGAGRWPIRDPVQRDGECSRSRPAGSGRRRTQERGIDPGTVVRDRELDARSRFFQPHLHQPSRGANLTRWPAVPDHCCSRLASPTRDRSRNRSPDRATFLASAAGRMVSSADSITSDSRTGRSSSELTGDDPRHIQYVGDELG